MMTRRVLVLTGFGVMLLRGDDPVTGKWDITLDTPGGERKAAPSFTLDGDKVGGKWDQSEVAGTFKDGKLELSFALTSNEAGQTAPLKISATIEGGAMKGTWSWATYDGRLTGKKQ